MEHWLEREIAQWVHPMKDWSDDPSHDERTLLPQSYISLHIAEILSLNESTDRFKHITISNNIVFWTVWYCMLFYISNFEPSVNILNKQGRKEMFYLTTHEPGVSILSNKTTTLPREGQTSTFSVTSTGTPSGCRCWSTRSWTRRPASARSCRRWPRCEQGR